MQNKSTHADSSSPRPLGTARLNDTPDSSKVVYAKTTIINVFFDGTNNNLYNIEARRSGQRTPDPETNESYYNDFSNVANLFRNIPTKNKDGYFYIDGMGTTRLEDDDQDGYAMGTGKTGIVERANQAFEQIVTYLKNLGNRPSHITLNVFGFSRGAATARRFVSLCNTDASKFGPFQDLQWYVNFVGIFDTVSSYAQDKATLLMQSKMGADKKKAFSDDISELKLKFDARKINGNTYNWARKVFHIVALDEFRINFALTNIASAVALGFGYEVKIPGAHSDIGGGYNAVVNEVQDFSALNDNNKLAFYAYLPYRGWYKPQHMRADGGAQNSVRLQAWRTGADAVKNNYSKISYQMMKDMINKYASYISFTDGKKVSDNHSDIQWLLDNWVPKALANDGAKSFTMPWPDKKDAWSQRIYHEFLHMSSNYKHSRGWTKPIVIPFEPNMELATIDGQRTMIPKRIIYNG